MRLALAGQSPASKVARRVARLCCCTAARNCEEGPLLEVGRNGWGDGREASARACGETLALCDDSDDPPNRIAITRSPGRGRGSSLTLRVRLWLGAPQPARTSHPLSEVHISAAPLIGVRPPGDRRGRSPPGTCRATPSATSGRRRAHGSVRPEVVTGVVTGLPARGGSDQPSSVAAIARRSTRTRG